MFETKWVGEKTDVRSYWLLALLVLILFAHSLQAQNTYEKFPTPELIGFEPESAFVGVSGRLFTLDGRGVRNAKVTVTNRLGVSITVTTASYGFYRFDALQAGETYVIIVSSKQFRFTPRLLILNDEATGIDFVAVE